MKTLSEFETISQAKAYKVTSKKMITSDTMRILLLKTGLYSYFKNSDSDLHQATWDNLASGGEFNFMQDHPKDVSGLMDLLILSEKDTEIQDKLTQFKTICVATANPETFPYEDITDEQWQEVQLAKAPTTREAICPGNVNYIAIKKGDVVNIRVTPTAPVDYDDTFIVRCSSAKNLLEPFSKDEVSRGIIKIPASSTESISLPTLNTRGLLTLVRIEVSSKYQRDFEVVANYGV